MLNKILLVLILGFIALCPQVALGDEIIVEDAETVWNLTLDDATEVEHLVGEPGVMVTKYADVFSYFSLENATAIGRLFGEPGVMVTKYADAFVYHLLEEATEIHYLVGEPGVMVTKYADTFSYSDLMSPPFDFTRVLITTDKYEYTTCDTMNITIGFRNPAASTKQNIFALGINFTDYNNAFFWLTASEIALPPKFNQSFTIPLHVDDWGSVEFNASWYVTLLNSTTYETISKNTADWRYNSSKVAEGEMILADIAEEMMKTVEIGKVELPS